MKFGRKKSTAPDVSTLPELPASFEDARPRLRARVYGAEQFGIDQLAAANAGAADAVSAVQRLSPDLWLGAVMALDAGDVKVSEPTLRSWGVTLEQVIRACRDAVGDHELSAERLGDASFLINDDVDAASVWSIPERAKALPLQGNPIAWAIAGNVTLVSGDADPQSMTIAARVIRRALDAGLVTSVTPHRLTDDRWAPIAWGAAADGDQLLVPRLHKAQLYQRQADWLQAWFGTRGEDVFVAEYAVWGTEGSPPMSVTTWTEGATIAIPETDAVSLVRPSDGSTRLLPWAALMEQAAGLLEPLGGVPARYVTRGFPTDQMVRAASPADYESASATTDPTDGASDYPEFIPRAGACLATHNVLEGRGRPRWMVRERSQNPSDNGWRIMSHLDTSDYLSDSANWQVADFNRICAIEPALIGIWDLAVGSDLQLVDDELGIRVVDTSTGQQIPEDNLYVPPDKRA